MLTQENVDQIFEEHDVWTRDPDATQQELNRIVFTVAQKRGALLGRPTWLIDGVFAAWAICLPFFPQPESYTRLMLIRRREWFDDASPNLRLLRAWQFFTDSLLRLDLHELADIVAAEDAPERIGGYLGDLGSVPARWTSGSPMVWTELDQEVGFDDVEEAVAEAIEEEEEEEEEELGT